MNGLTARAWLAAMLIAVAGGWSSMAHAQACGSISPNACATVPVATSPGFSLSFAAPAGGLSDTGFTMVQSHSTNRYPAVPTIPATPGFEPANLSVAGGQLVITSTRGSFLQTQTEGTGNNTQVNALGVGIGTPYLETVLAVDLINPPFPSATLNEQAGIWFGLDEDNYVRLAVANRSGAGAGSIELRREIGGATSTGATDFRTTDVTAVNTATIRLTLTLDRVANEVRGTYSSSTGETGTLGPLAVPAAFFAGQMLADGTTGPVSFGGVYVTSRANSATPAIPFNFDNFSATSAAPPAAVPTLTEWAMILLSGLLALTGAALIRRRQVVANG